MMNHKVAGIINDRMVGGDESENVVNEGQSSESVTNVYNSIGPPQDYESSDTSLKLGWVQFNYHNSSLNAFYIMNRGVKNMVIIGKLLLTLLIIILPFSSS